MLIIVLCTWHCRNNHPLLFCVRFDKVYYGPDVCFRGCIMDSVTSTLLPLMPTVPAHPVFSDNNTKSSAKWEKRLVSFSSQTKSASDLNTKGLRLKTGGSCADLLIRMDRGQRLQFEPLSLFNNMFGLYHHTLMLSGKSAEKIVFPRKCAGIMPPRLSL